MIKTNRSSLADQPCCVLINFGIVKCVSYLYEQMPNPTTCRGALFGAMSRDLLKTSEPYHTIHCAHIMSTALSKGVGSNVNHKDDLFIHLL